MMDEEKATELKGTLTLVSSHSSVQSSRVARLLDSSIGTSLMRATCVDAEPPRGTILLDDHLPFGQCPLQESVIRGSAEEHGVVSAVTCAALVWEATAAMRATWVVASAVA
jgi:hypothetical protein